MRSSYDGWTVREAYDELGSDVLDVVYDSRGEDLPRNSDEEVVSLIDNEGLEVDYDRTWGKQMEAKGNSSSALKAFSGILGKADPLKRLGASRTSTEGSDTEVVDSYNSSMKPSHAALGAAAGGSLMAGPPENSVFYETFKDGLPADILFGIGAVAGTGIVAGQRYDSGRREELGGEIRERRAEELVERFGDYTIVEKD